MHRIMECLNVEFVTAICAACLLVGCGEVDTNYIISGNSRRNMGVISLVDSTAERLHLKSDKEGMSSTWHSYDRGALSYDLGTQLGTSTTVFFADGRLAHKRGFNRVKQDLTHGLRRIDPKMQMNTRWVTNPMM
jgi:hypothetical protein